MDELANTLLDRINGLAKKSLRAGENFTDEQHRVALVRITENVRLIKKIEKVSGAESDSDDDDDDVETTTGNRRGRKSVAPSAAV